VWRMLGSSRFKLMCKGVYIGGHMRRSLPKKREIWRSTHVVKAVECSVNPGMEHLRAWEVPRCNILEQVFLLESGKIENAKSRELQESESSSVIIAYGWLELSATRRLVGEISFLRTTDDLESHYG